MWNDNSKADQLLTYCGLKSRQTIGSITYSQHTWFSCWPYWEIKDLTQGYQTYDPQTWKLTKKKKKAQSSQTGWLCNADKAGVHGFCSFHCIYSRERGGEWKGSHEEWCRAMKVVVYPSRRFESRSLTSLSYWQIHFPFSATPHQSKVVKIRSDL